MRLDMADVRGCLLLPFLIVLAPIWIPLLLTEAFFWPSEWMLKARMKRRGRLLKAKSIPDSGTIIIDWPTFNWGISRIWWTPDDVEALAPIGPPPGRELQYVISRVERDEQ